MERHKRLQSRLRELRRRRVLKVEDVVRPLHVSEVQLKASRFSWPRPCLLLVTATAVVLLDVQSQGELEARDGSHASIQLAVRAGEVVDVSLVSGGLRVEYRAPGALKVSPAVFGFGGGAPPGPGAASATASASSPPRRQGGTAGGRESADASHGGAGAASVDDSTASSGAAAPGGHGAAAAAPSLRRRILGSPRGSEGGPGPGPGAGAAGGASSGGLPPSGASASADALYQLEAATLLFDDPEAARAAAGAIAYARSVDADASRWVACAQRPACAQHRSAPPAQAPCATSGRGWQAPCAPRRAARPARRAASSSSNGAAAPPAARPEAAPAPATAAGAARYGWRFNDAPQPGAGARVRRGPPVEDIPVALIRRPLGRTRANDQDKVEALMRSIQEIGLQEPIDVLLVEGVYYGFSGCHRFEAHQRLGLPTIACRVRKAGRDALRMHMM